LIFKVLILKLIILSFISCNSADIQSLSESDKDKKTLNYRPSPIAEKGKCIADKLSFLVGQPDSALNAMDYPLNTRVMVVGQIVSDQIDPERLNLVIGSEKKIVFVYCG